MGTRNQTDTTPSAEVLVHCGLSNRVAFTHFMMSNASLGTVSHSIDALTAGFGLQRLLYFITSADDPSTATWAGNCVMRFNITTANSNVTWSNLYWVEITPSGQLQRSCVTTTSGLAIGLGTTGVKTASVGVGTFAALSLDSRCLLSIVGSSGSAMIATFVCVKNQVIDVPFTASAAPATTAIASIAILNAGF